MCPDGTIEIANHDIGLAIDAERDEGVTMVKVRTTTYCNTESLVSPEQ